METDKFRTGDHANLSTLSEISLAPKDHLVQHQDRVWEGPLEPHQAMTSRLKDAASCTVLEDVARMLSLHMASALLTFAMSDSGSGSSVPLRRQ
jgi:hypothetical protein